MTYGEIIEELYEMNWLYFANGYCCLDCIAANKLAVGSLNAITDTSVTFPTTRIFTQQLLEKAKFNQPTPN